MTNISDRTTRNKALQEGPDALHEEFCKLSLSAQHQSIFLKDWNGCSLDNKCKTEEGLPTMQLFSNNELIVDPNLEGDTLKWQDKSGAQLEYQVKDCPKPTS